MSEKSEYGDIASRLLFENEKVKIWELKLAPGGRSALHKHDYDNILIQIAGDRVAVEPDPATKGEYDEYFEAEIIPGNVIYVGKGGIETAVNVGKQPYHEIIVELKE